MESAFYVNSWRAKAEYFAGRDVDFVEYTTAAVLRATLVDFGYPDVPDNVLRPALRAMYAVTQAYWLPEVEAVPTLRALCQQGYRLGLLSNAGDDADVQTLVDKAELRPYLDFVISSAAQGIRKPNPKIFQAALAHWKFTPTRVAMVGDMLGADILGAHNAGMYGIWITGRAENDQNRAHLDTIRPDATITTLSELPGLLETLSVKRGK